MPNLITLIPALDAAATLPATLEALAGERVGVVDGGSRDGTEAVARQGGAEVIPAPRGRGPQLAAGADWALAEGAEWLLFLHADTVLEAGWRDRAEHAGVFDHPERAAYFRLAFTGVEGRDARGRDARAARRVAGLANARARWLGLPYGDQGLLISAALYRAVGGYRPLPLMEDVDLVRRLGRARLHPLPCRAWTSPRRYQQGGWILRPLRNLLCLSLYLCGVAPHRLVRLYRG